MSTVGEALPPAPLDNDRPVEVTYIPEATFADILDIGVAELAVRDATVIERITEPGYEDFLGDVSRFVTRRNWMRRLAHERTKRFVEHNPFHNRMMQLNEELFQNVSGNGRKIFKSPVLGYSLLGVHPEDWNCRSQSPHTDVNSSGIPQATLNFTLYHASAEAWQWRLTPGVIRSPRSAHYEQPSVDVPLTPPGCVILGDNSRESEDLGLPCTVGHQVISPPSAWEGTKIQRVRELVISG